MAQILLLPHAGLLKDEEVSMIQKQPEDILSGNMSQNIKRLAYDLIASTLQESLRNIDTIKEHYRAAIKGLNSFVKKILSMKIQQILGQDYSAVLASNFGLAMNTMLAFFNLLEGEINNLVIKDFKMDPGAINRTLRSPILSNYLVHPELQDPSDIPQEQDSLTYKLIQSLILTCNLISFQILIALVIHIAHAKIEIEPKQIDELEHLLRDWTLEILIQIEESFDVELDVGGPYDISIPTHSEDHALAEMGLDDYLEKLE